MLLVLNDQSEYCLGRYSSVLFHCDQTKSSYRDVVQVHELNCNQLISSHVHDLVRTMFAYNRSMMQWNSMLCSMNFDQIDLHDIEEEMNHEE